MPNHLRKLKMGIGEVKVGPSFFSCIYPIPLEPQRRKREEGKPFPLPPPLLPLGCQTALAAGWNFSWKEGGKGRRERWRKSRTNRAFTKQKVKIRNRNIFTLKEMYFSVSFFGIFLYKYMLLNLAHRHTHRPIPSLFSTAVAAEASPSSSSFSLFHLSICLSVSRRRRGERKRRRRVWNWGHGKGKGGFGIRDFTRLVVLFSSPFSPSRKRRKRDI